MSAQGCEAEPAADQTTQCAPLAQNTLPFRMKPAPTNESAQPRPSSPQPAAVTKVGPDMSPLSAPSAANLGSRSSAAEDEHVHPKSPSDLESAKPVLFLDLSSLLDDGHRIMTSLSRSSTLASGPATPKLDDLFERPARTDSMATYATDITDFEPCSPVTSSSTTGYPGLVKDRAITHEPDNVIPEAEPPIKSSMSKTHDPLGPEIKRKRSVHWADRETGEPLASGTTIPPNNRAGRPYLETSKPVLSQKTFPLASHELRVHAAGISAHSHARLGATTLGPKGPLNSTLSVSQIQIAMVEAGISDMTEAEDKLKRFIQACHNISFTSGPDMKATEDDAVSDDPAEPPDPTATHPQTPDRVMDSTEESVSTPEGQGSPVAPFTPSTSSDSDSDHDVDDGVLYEELGDELQDRFVQNVHNVILQHMPDVVVDELVQPLKDLSVRCVEEALNLAQGLINKRAAVGSATAEYCDDSTQSSSEQPACDGASPSHPAHSDDAGGCSGQGQGQTNPRKRSIDGSSNDSESGEGNDAGDDSRSNGTIAKKPKPAGINPKDEVFSCPFRKRNPLRFNVRDHDTCARQGFQGMSLLKRHVKFQHHVKSRRESFTCDHCKTTFETEDERREHEKRKAVESCVFREDYVIENPEDGITNALADVLAGRKKDRKVNTYGSLWAALFPKDKHAPDGAFVPPVEIFEVRDEFSLSDEGTRPLKEMDGPCRDYVTRKLDICDRNPTKLRGDGRGGRRGAHVDAPNPLSHGAATNPPPVIGAPSGVSMIHRPLVFTTPTPVMRTGPPGQDGRLQMPAPEMTPTATFPDNSFGLPLSAQPNYQQQQLQPQQGSTPTPSRRNARSIVPQPRSRILKQSTLLPRPAAKAANTATSSLQKQPIYPTTPIAANPIQASPYLTGTNAGSQMDLNGYGDMGGVNHGAGTDTNLWVQEQFRYADSTANTSSHMAMGEMAVAMPMMRRQSSGADAAIYNPQTLRPEQQEQQQQQAFIEPSPANSFVGDSSACYGFPQQALMGDFGGFGGDGTLQNGAMPGVPKTSMSDVPTTTAAMMASSSALYHVPVGGADPFGPAVPIGDGGLTLGAACMLSAPSTGMSGVDDGDLGLLEQYMLESNRQDEEGLLGPAPSGDLMDDGAEWEKV